jgi:hypothetical protein
MVVANHIYSFISLRYPPSKTPRRKKAVVYERASCTNVKNTFLLLINLSLWSHRSPGTGTTAAGCGRRGTLPRTTRETGDGIAQSSSTVWSDQGGCRSEGEGEAGGAEGQGAGPQGQHPHWDGSAELLKRCTCVCFGVVGLSGDC